MCVCVCVCACMHVMCCVCVCRCVTTGEDQECFPVGKGPIRGLEECKEDISDNTCEELDCVGSCSVY